MRDAVQPNDDQYALFARVFAGEASASDRVALEQWIQADPARGALVESLHATWRRSGTLYPDADAKTALVEIRNQIARNRRSIRLTSEWQSPFARRPFAWAAMLALCVGIGAYVAGRSATHTDTAAASSSTITEVVTTRGQRASVRLADGSRVTLGVASRMRYPREFGATSRDIELEGEAYFDVVHDGRAPFRVRTAHGVTEDIGTKFSVRAYAGEPRTRVVVEEGKVSVAPGVTLGAGDVARISPDGPPAIAHGVAVGPLLSWTMGQLEFVNVPLREVAADLTRWYDVDVRIPDEMLAQHPVMASFRNAPIGDVLDFIVRVVSARVERHGNSYVLVPEAHAASARAARSHP